MVWGARRRRRSGERLVTRPLPSCWVFAVGLCGVSVGFYGFLYLPCRCASCGI